MQRDDVAPFDRVASHVALRVPAPSRDRCDREIGRVTLAPGALQPVPVRARHVVRPGFPALILARRHAQQSRHLLLGATGGQPIVAQLGAGRRPGCILTLGPQDDTATPFQGHGRTAVVARGNLTIVRVVIVSYIAAMAAGRALVHVEHAGGRWLHGAS
ncbi:hypothetical protein BGLA2_700101 [Burkholderia gladioli]|nr:hypothetical protein BGLA2_700101 [Burkholderia gladioli]